ncbi:MAG: HAD family hydrolase [Clostridia bacterium]|nr:HAD family hydrolase [Clostridia bacterium]
MNELNGYVILTDLDGTFLGQKGALVERNMKAVDWFKAHGGIFTFSTGRMLCNIGRVIPDAGSLVNAPVVACNGALITDLATDTPYAEILFPHDKGWPILRYVMEHYPDLGVRVSTPQGFVTTEKMLRFPLIQRDIATCVNGHYLITDVENWDSLKWYKFVVRGDSDVLDRLRAEVEERFSDDADFSKSGKTFFEAQSKGVTKAVMIPKLKRILEDQTDRSLTVICCGDYENDITMLKAADISVCPSNAIDEVKSIADYCLCSNTEGLIADIVEMLAAKHGIDVKF